MTSASAPFLGLNPRRYGLPDTLAADVELVDRLLGTLLCEQDEGAVLTAARRLYESADSSDSQALERELAALGDPRLVQRLLRAYTVLFQLLNSAEQKEIVRANAEQQARAGPTPRPESIAEAIGRLCEAGMPAAEMQRLLDRLDIVPTLTAHPSEARRRSVLDKLQDIAQALIAHGGANAASRAPRAPEGPERFEHEILRTLTALWQTEELRATQLTVADEAANALYFLEHSILELVTWLHADLERALERHYPGHAFTIAPFVRYRSWVGGDRDGNPNVTPEVTWQTLLAQSARVFEHYLRRVDVLRRELTQSTRLVPASPALLQSLEEDARVNALPDEVRARYRREPYALKLVHVEARLRASLEHCSRLADFREAHAISPAPAPAYRTAAAFVQDLRLMQESLEQNRGARLAREGALPRLAVQAMTFGFHLAALDVRQHSEEHERAIEELLCAAGVLPPEHSYEPLPEDEKVTLLTRELRNPRPLLPIGWSGSPETRGVLDVFNVMRQAQRHVSAEAMNTYVISMTHGVSDILEVLLLAREAGLVRWGVEGAGRVLESDLDVVPLFETIDDLRRCADLMRGLFEDPGYREQLRARGNFQEIMLGYSDSSKDGGFLAANARLYETQTRLAKVCRDAGVAVRFFHGRGGTVGRGGGRANRAILSQPAGSFDGSIRFTEQGEVISFRYSVLPLGHRHMEQIVNAALLAASHRTSPPVVRPEWQDALESMAEHSLAAYRELVHEDAEFWSFYSQATPIHHISRLPIASRPASRGRHPAGLEALRAIPWVFAWVQSRYVVPGWYGLGSAMQAYAQQGAQELATLEAMCREWVFFRMVVNNAQLELLRAHLPTARWYAARVQPEALGVRVHERIAREHALTCEWILRVTGQKDLLEHAPVVRRTVKLRNPALMPLSRLQVALMARLDGGAQDKADADADAQWQEALLLSITSIAAAMQSTG